MSGRNLREKAPASLDADEDPLVLVGRVREEMHEARISQLREHVELLDELRVALPRAAQVPLDRHVAELFQRTWWAARLGGAGARSRRGRRARVDRPEAAGADAPRLVEASRREADGPHVHAHRVAPRDAHAHAARTPQEERLPLRVGRRGRRGPRRVLEELVDGPPEAREGPGPLLGGHAVLCLVGLDDADLRRVHDAVREDEPQEQPVVRPARRPAVRAPPQVAAFGTSRVRSTVETRSKNRASTSERSSSARSRARGPTPRASSPAPPGPRPARRRRGRGPPRRA